MSDSYRVPGFDGLKQGRPLKLSPKQVKVMVAAAQRGMTAQGLARRFRVSAVTIRKYLKRAAGK
jgi:response regulator of citrate/malate metabolism